MRTRALLAAALLAGCAAPRPDAVSRLWIVHGKVFDCPGKTAVLVEGNRIARVADALPAGEEGRARVIDARGGLILPGFQDAHVHLMSGGSAKEGVDLSECETLEATLEAVKKFAEAHPELAWIKGRGWQYGIVPAGKFPTRQDLDRAVPGRPALLTSYDGHSAWANTKAFELAGVDATTEDPEDGKIVREADGKTPQGALLEGAEGAVGHGLPRRTRAEKLAALEGALAECARLGYTTVADIEAEPEVLEMFRELEARGALPVRVVLGLPIEGIETLWGALYYAFLRERYSSPTLRFGFLKGFVDGVIESKTAYMLEPYEGSSERGKPLIPPGELDWLVERAQTMRFQVALHSIGDGAVRESLDAYEKAERRHPRIELRHRVEHVEAIDPRDIPRFAALGVVASMQPFHALPEPETAVWSSNLGKRRLPFTFAWRGVLDTRAFLAFGTDWPVASLNPLVGLAVAATRQDAKGEPKGGWNAHQAIRIEEAIRAFTLGSAQASHSEKETGTIEVGKLADLVVLSSDVRLDDPRTFWNGHVVYTIVDGRVRHEAK